MICDQYDWHYKASGINTLDNTSYRHLGMDNGVTYVTFFRDDVKQSLYTYDTSDIFNWDRKETAYDANGEVNFRGTVFDDSVMTLSWLEDGAVVSMAQTDQNNARNWDTIDTVYVSGTRTTTGVRGRKSIRWTSALGIAAQRHISTLASWPCPRPHWTAATKSSLPIRPTATYASKSTAMTVTHGHTA